LYNSKFFITFAAGLDAKAPRTPAHPRQDNEKTDEYGNARVKTNANDYRVFGFGIAATSILYG
jgi:hypothetical protein